MNTEKSVMNIVNDIQTKQDMLNSQTDLTSQALRNFPS